MGKAEGGVETRGRYRGGIRSAPSSLMVSPFIIGFSAMWQASARELLGPAEPGREGDLLAQRLARLLGEGGQQRRVEEAGRDGHTRMPLRARSRAAGRVRPTTPPLEAA